MINRFGAFTLLALIFSPAAIAQDNSDGQRPAPVFAEGLAPVEVVVTGRHPGPPLWKVTNGDNVLWIFPYVSPLPKRMIWDSSRVERLIAESQEFIDRPVVNLGAGFRQSRINLEDNQTLEDVLPVEQFDRLVALDQAGLIKFNKKQRRMSPKVAGPTFVSSVISNSGLESASSILKTVNKYVRRNNSITQTEIVTGLDKESAKEFKEFMITSMTAEPDSDIAIACMDFSLKRVATEVDVLIRRANAWATGNADGLRRDTLPETESNPCSASLTDDNLISAISEPYLQAYDEWLNAAEAALYKNKSSFSVLNLDDLLAEEGKLQALEARGFTVLVP